MKLWRYIKWQRAKLTFYWRSLRGRCVVCGNPAADDVLCSRCWRDLRIVR